ncbi:hypothetical protein REPUB_Repub04eG0169800 [Reevesia pubescens]
MSLKVVDETISSFDSIFEKFILDAPNNKANFIIFLVDKDLFTTLSWCPKCVSAKPMIYKKLETKTLSEDEDVALLRAYVGDIPTWRNPQQPWRLHPTLGGYTLHSNSLKSQLCFSGSGNNKDRHNVEEAAMTTGDGGNED